jgi:hypothetical protein
MTEGPFFIDIIPKFVIIGLSHSSKGPAVQGTFQIDAAGIMVQPVSFRLKLGKESVRTSGRARNKPCTVSQP